MTRPLTKQARVAWLVAQAALELDASAHEVNAALRIAYRRSAAVFARAAVREQQVNP